MSLPVFDFDVYLIESRFRVHLAVYESNAFENMLYLLSLEIEIVFVSKEIIAFGRGISETRSRLPTIPSQRKRN